MKRILPLGAAALLAFATAAAYIRRPSVPSPAHETYLIQPRDTLGQIARRYHTSVDMLLRLNPAIKDPDLIYAGTRIRIPPEQKRKNPHTNIDAIVQIESQNRQFSNDGAVLTSPKGAVGIMQLTQQGVRYLNQCTHKKDDRVKIGSRHGKPIYIGVLEGTYSWKKIQNNPAANRQAGRDYVQILEKMFSGWKHADELVVASYNAGFPQIKNAVREARRHGLSDSENIDVYKRFLGPRAKRETVKYVHDYRTLRD